MNRSDYLAAQTENYARCLELSEEKSSDYADGDDPFKNFRLAAEIAGCPVWQVMLSRIAEKVVRVGNLLKKRDRGEERAVDDEPVEKTLEDLIVYPNLLKIWLSQEGAGQVEEDPCDGCIEEDCGGCIEIVDFKPANDDDTCECDPEVRPEFTHTCQCEACKTMRGMGPASFIFYDPPKVVMAAYDGFPQRQEFEDLDTLDIEFDKLQAEKEQKDK
jgi:hypothetical protein